MSPAATTTPISSGQNRRALLAERLRRAARGMRQSPLSFAQQRLWFLDQLAPDSPLYNIATVLRLCGALDVPALERAINSVVARHETLRAHFLCPDGTPIQRIEPAVRIPLRLVDLSAEPKEKAEAEARRLTAEEIRRPFNLSRVPLLRAVLLRLAAQEHRLVLVLHHIVADEWSLRVFFREMAAFYSGLVGPQAATLPPLPIQYSDYAQWQRDSLQGEFLEGQLAYWRHQLRDLPPATSLPLDAPRRGVPAFRGGNESLALDGELARKLKALGDAHGATLFMVLLAGFNALVHRYTGAEDVVVGSPIAGRSQVETEGLIGFFVNTLPFRTRFGHDPRFSELLALVRETALEAYAHQDLPLDKLVEDLHPERSMEHLPFTRLMFLVQNRWPAEMEMPGLQVEPLEVEAETSKFDLTMFVQETQEGLVARVEYNRDLFAGPTMRRLLAHYENLLRGIVAAPDQRLSQLPLLTEAERDQILQEWNRTSTSYPRGKCIHEVFEGQAERAPGASAVVFGAQTLTYSELNARANQLARHLRQCGVGAETPVGICLERSLDLVIALLATLKAGGAYVPLDPAYPRERLAFMLADAQTPVLLTHQALLPLLPETGVRTLCLDADWELIARESRQNLPNGVGPESLAYIMFTSGSTGQPKGVAVPHRGVTRLVLDTNYIQLDPSDRMAQISNISFDASTFEIWGALLNGGRLVVITKDVALSPADFARELRQQGITAIFLTSALFNQMAAEVPEGLAGLRTVIAGGDALDPKWVRTVLRRGPPRRLVNGYGPTENTTFTCCHLIADLAEDSLNVPIGRPIANTQVYILDRYLNPVPIGVPGELYAGGDGLARGYWNRPELNAKKFVPNPFNAGSSASLYRTGDLARYLPDGTIEFLGRIDQQVKIRGFRVELSEIETILAQHPEVRQCAVTVSGEGASGKRLVAYVVPDGNPPPNASELRRFLAEKLPDYMIPSAFMALDAMPLTPNGKLNRQSLPALEQARPELERKYVAPRDEVERHLTAIWENVLNVRPVGTQDKFFDLGGHSLLAVRLIAQIEKAFGRKLRLATIFQSPTIEQVAAVLREEAKVAAEAVSSSLVEIQGRGTRPPLFLVHGAGGGMFWGYVNLCRHLGTDQPVYGFKSGGLDGREELSSIEEMAARYIKDMRAAQPSGPYYLGGYCFGGNVAFEMACQLAAQGEEVAFLALLNCAPPNSSYTRIPWDPVWFARFLRNLWYYANYFRHWSAPQRAGFFRWKWSVARKRLGRLVGAGAGKSLHVEAGDLVDLTSLTAVQRSIWEVHIWALLNFHPSSYTGRVHLYRSPGHPLWCSFAPDYGWGALAKGGVGVTVVPGVHEKLLEEPCVRVLACELDKALTAAQTMAPIAGGSAVHSSAPPEAGKALPENALPAQGPGPDPGAPVTRPQGTLSIATGPKIEVPATTTLASQIAAQVERAPSAIAVRFEGQELTYGELNARANQLARSLQALGAGPEMLVALCLERSLNLPVALLAILKSGSAYLPLDPHYPTERLAYMLADSRAPILVTQKTLAPIFAAASCRALLVDDPGQQANVSLYSIANLDPRGGLDDLAYVIYTSGSTGLPKGVQITQRSLLNHNFAAAHTYGLTRADRVLQFTPLSFDISVEEIFPSWLSGATVVFRNEEAIASPERFLEFLTEERLSVLNLPTAYWHELVDFLCASGSTLPKCVRLVVVGGEKVSFEHFQRWKQRVPQSVILMNGYGATEATVTTTVHVARPGDDCFPIGRPLANMTVAILDEHGRLAPAGQEGELYIGGAGVGRGYLSRPELTAERFIRNPFPEIDSERLYRTGDLARLRQDGNLEFIGRLDEQVKIRGYRIELGEIEAALRAHPGLADAVVAAREDHPGKKRLVAYVVPRLEPGPRVNELVRFLKRRLPAYMVPSAFVCLRELPLSPTGKVDRRSLPMPDRSRPALDQELLPARTPIEEALVSIWSEVLGLAPIGVRDSFFDLGGHSLLATQVLARIRDSLKVEVPLGEFFARPTVEELADYLSGSGAPGQPVLPTSVLASATRLPLSPRQRRLWLLEQFHRNRAPFNRAAGVKLSGALHKSALEQALTELARRHDALRTVFPRTNGQPVQYVCEPTEIALPVIDLTVLPENERARAAQMRAEQEARRPYILNHPLLRPLLLRLRPTEHWLVLVLHNIGADSRSVRLLLSELAALYEAFALHQPNPLPDAPPPYSEVVSLTRQTSETEAEELGYWKKQLAGAPALMELPADRPRPAQRSGNGAMLPFRIPDGLLERLRALSHEQGCTLFTTILGGLAGVCHRYTGSEDLVIGSLFHHSARADWEKLVANFENPVALRCNLEGDPEFRTLLQRLRAVTGEAFAHKSLPFGRLVEELEPERNASYSSVFQVMLVLEEEALPEHRAAEVNFTPFEVDTRTAELDLFIRLGSGPSGVSGWVEYNTDIFDEDRIARFTQHLLTLLDGAAADCTARLSQLPLLPQAERARLQEWNKTERQFPRDQTLANLFLEQVARTPDAVAVVSGTTRLTYRELRGRAEEIAGALRERGVGAGSLVGICLERSPDLVASMLGTFLAGGAYVPLDPAYPAERLDVIMHDASLAALVSRKLFNDILPQSGAAVLWLDELSAGSPVRDVAGPGRRVCAPEDLAYVIYTSGSTGRPKGVALEHRNAVAFACWAREAFSTEELSGVLASTSVCFDLSVFEIFVPLCWGGKLILADNALALAGLPAANEVKLINTVPSAMRGLLRLKAVPDSVTVVNLAGEPLATSLVDDIYRQTRVRKVFDLYGPTEATTYSTCALRRAGEAATIGRPLANEQVYLLDRHLQLAPIGVPAELYIGGEGLARGYLNRPDLTAERFIQHPFLRGARLYRTGDLARWRPDGNLEYLGRIDHQVKIRGFRIELGEIEAVLKMHPAVRESVVLAREDHPGEKRLVAYIVAAPGQAPAASDLRGFTRKKLPEFMVPSAFLFLERLPLTPNGKLDRKALPAEGEDKSAHTSDFVAPRTPVEEKIAAVWKEVLRLEHVSVEANFFELGGHSLLATQVISRLCETFRVDLPLLGFFAAPTIAALAQGVASGKWGPADASTPLLEPVPRGGRHPVSFVQERLWFLDQLVPGGRAYNVPAALRLKGRLDLSALQRAAREVVGRHEALRATFRFVDGNLAQEIAPAMTVELPLDDLSDRDEPDRTRAAEEWLRQDAQAPFELARGPLWRMRLARLSETEHLLSVVAHHAVIDGWSLALLFRELQSYYDAFASGAPPPALPELPVQYLDYVHWQREWMKGPVLEREVAHWKKILAGAPPAIALPADFAPSPGTSGKALRLSKVIPPELTKTMAELGHSGTTPFMLLMAALAVTLHKWSGQRDLVIGTVVAGRGRREFESIIGCFMNFLPIRIRIAGSDTAQAVLERVRGTVLDAQAHQECPFEKIVEAVNPERRLNTNPLYNVGLLLQNFPAELFPSKLVEASPQPVFTDAALLDLRFEAENSAEGLVLSCEYRPELFKPGTIEQLLASCLDVLRKLAREPQTAIGSFDLTPALAEQARAASPGRARRTLALSATFTAEPIAEPLQYWLRELDVEAEVEFAPYNQVFQQLLDPASAFGSNRDGLNVILVRLEDWMPGADASGQMEGAEAARNLDRNVEEFVSALRKAAGRNSTPFLVCLCPASPLRASQSGCGELLAINEKRLADALTGLAGVYVLTSAELARWYPVTDYSDPHAEELAHVPYTPLFFTALATAVVRKFHALVRPAHKVIVLDCDQTLWCGVCGEDGPQGIRLEAAHRALQEFMRAQQEAGMLLCLCSKNNEADVWEVFNQRAEMPLRREHLSAWRLNWQPKSENLKSLAQQLRLGLDSFIFVDDNPLECAEVEANCPEVLTLQLPEDPELIPQFLQHCWVFDHLKVTAEDRRRAEFYRQNEERKKFREQSGSLADFVAGLELKVSIEAMAADQVARVAQLTQRTNQFNATGYRLTEGEVRQFPSETEVLAVQVSDRFGDYGLAGVIICQPRNGSLDVSHFLLSCRVLGRGVEHRMLARVGEIARSRGAHWLDVHYVRTDRNKPALDFLQAVGAQFKQPLNGGYIFRFPASFAAGVRFNPTAAALEQVTPAPSSGASPAAATAPGTRSKFAQCRAIALQACDPAQIHQAIEIKAPLRARKQSDYAAPRTELERQLCEIWSEVIRVERVGIHDDFFELGGHSLLAVRLFSEIEKLTGKKLPLVTLFQAPTVAELAGVLRSGKVEASDSLLVPIQPRGSRPPLFLVHGAGGDVLWGYANLASHLPPDQPVYGIKSRGQTGQEESATLREMAATYLQAVREFQPQGPYYLGGYCFGGNVAYEMARQLHAQGERVALVALLDSTPANAAYEQVPWWRPRFWCRFSVNAFYWLRDFAALPPRDRRRFFGRKIRSLGRKMARRIWARSGAESVDLEEVIDPAHFPQNELKLWQIHLQALINHVEQSYQGPVTLLRTRGQALFCSLEEDFCWGRLAQGGVRVVFIPGSHENIFVEPNVDCLARELSAALAAAQPVPESPATYDLA